MKRAGDVKGTPSWQLEGVPMDNTWAEKEITPPKRGAFEGLTTKATVIITENDDGGKTNMSEMREERFKIEDDMTAEWAMEQIRNAEAEKAKWKEFYDSRYKAVCETCDLTISNMESLLQSYFATVPHKVTRTQENYALPSGKLVFKKQDVEYERDDEKIIEWLKQNNGESFVKTKEVLDWSALKKSVTVLGETVVDADGQIIPGIKATERPDIFKVELKKEA